MNDHPEPHDPYADTARLSPVSPSAPTAQWREPDPTKHDLPAYAPPAYVPPAPPVAVPVPMPPVMAPPAFPQVPAFQQVQPFHPGYPPPSARPLKSTSAAVMLEVFLGLFGLFGVGALYAGRTGLGVTLMVTYWLFFWVNVALAFVLVGIVTGPLTWLVYMIMAPVLAARAVDQHNAY